MKRWMMVWLAAVALGAILSLQMGGFVWLYLWLRWLVGAALTMGAVWAWARFCYLPGGSERGQEEQPPLPAAHSVPDAPDSEG